VPEQRYRAQLRRIHERVRAGAPAAARFGLPQPDWSLTPGGAAFGDPGRTARTIERFNQIAREEIDVRYLGLLRLAQAFGPILRFRGTDGVNSAAAFVNLLSVHALMNWPAYGSYSATEAACLSAAQCMRAELRPGGVKVLNVFFGPLETEWFQTVPPPKVAPATLANAVVRALRQGTEDAFVGDVAEDIRQRLAVNPKALEREMAS